MHISQNIWAFIQKKDAHASAQGGKRLHATVYGKKKLSVTHGIIQ